MLIRQFIVRFRLHGFIWREKQYLDPDSGNSSRRSSEVLDHGDNPKNPKFVGVWIPCGEIVGFSYAADKVFPEPIRRTLFSEHGDLADVGGGFSLAAGGSDYGQDG